MLSKIVFVSSSTEVWGAETSMLSIALSVRNPELITVEGGLADEWRQQLGKEPVVVRQTRAARLQSLAFLPSILKLARPGVMFIGFCLNALPALSIASCVVRPLGAGVVLDLHNSATTARAKRRFRLCTLPMNGVIGVSEYVLNQANLQPRGIVVHRPIPPSKVVQAPLSNLPITVGYVGRLDPEKNIEEIILGVQKTGRDVVQKLTVRGESMVGDEKYAESLKSLAESLIPGRYEFTGRLPQDVVMAGIDILVCANAREPSGRTVAEAQRSGIPAVVPSGGGCREFVVDGISGRIYQGGSPEDLANSIVSVATDCAVGRPMSPSAVARWAEAEYDQLVQAAKYSSALQQFLASKPSSWRWFQTGAAGIGSSLAFYPTRSERRRRSGSADDRTRSST